MRPSRRVSRQVLASLVSPAAAGRRGDPPPWKAGAQVREALFDAQEALLLGDAGGDRAVARAARAYRGAAADRHPRAPIRPRTAPSSRGLRAAARAPDAVALAAARGSVARRALPRRRRGDVDAVGARRRADGPQLAAAARVPHADALHAPRRRRDRRAARARARPDVARAGAARRGQGPARLDAGRGARARSRRSGGSASAASPPTAPSWPRRSPAPGRCSRRATARSAATPPRREAEAAVAALLDAALRDDDAAVEAARADVADRLSGFTAAPFTAEEQARRANQLSKFVSLIAVEYDHGVEGDRVTIPFEIQEGVAFSTAGPGRARRPPGHAGADRRAPHGGRRARACASSTASCAAPRSSRRACPRSTPSRRRSRRSRSSSARSIPTPGRSSRTPATSTSCRSRSTGSSSRSPPGATARPSRPASSCTRSSSSGPSGGCRRSIPRWPPTSRA